MTKSKKILFLFVFSLLSAASFAQQPKEIARSTNSWFMLYNDFKFSSKWSLSNELHIRRADVFSEWQQFLLRPALNFQLNPNVELSAGYTYIESYPYGEQPLKIEVPENNIWQQVQLKHSIGKLGVVHRYRLEERWTGNVISQPDDTYALDGTNYRQRFRYRITLKLPLHTFRNNQQLFAAAFDELWVNLEDNFMVSSFNQNWWYVGLGYQFNRQGNIQAGYLQQLIAKGDGIHYEINPTLNVSLFYNFDLSRKKAEN